MFSDKGFDFFPVRHSGIFCGWCGHFLSVPACNQGKWDSTPAEVVPFHFYLPVWQTRPVVREKHVLGAFGLSYLSASGESSPLLSMHDLTF